MGDPEDEIDDAKEPAPPAEGTDTPPEDETTETPAEGDGEAA